MKKEIMYNIYNLIKEDYIINDLRDFILLSDSASEFLLDILKICKDKIEENNLKEFIDLSYSIDYISDFELKNDVKIKVKEMLLSDYIRNDSNLCEMIDTINYLLTYDYWESFDFYEKEEMSFYMHFLVSNLIEIIKSILNEKVDMDKLYVHNMAFVLNSYTDVLHNINRTESSNKDLTENDIKINRLKYFKNILSNNDIIELNNNKYNAVVKIASSINNIEKLKKFENIVVFNKLRSNSDFERILDDYTDDLNDVTINRIYKKLGVTSIENKEKDQIEYYKKNMSDEMEDKIMKKILKPEKTIDFK